MSESVYPVTTRGPRLTYIKFGRRSSLETFAVVSGGMCAWRKSDVSDADYRASAAQAGRERLPARSTTRRARDYRAERHLAKHQPARVATPDLPKMRGEFMLVSVENPDGEGPRRIIAQCTGQYCAEAPNTARFEVGEWIGAKSKGRHSCGPCASQRRAAIDRAVRARQRGEAKVQA